MKAVAIVFFMTVLMFGFNILNMVDFIPVAENSQKGMVFSEFNHQLSVESEQICNEDNLACKIQTKDIGKPVSGVGDSGTGFFDQLVGTARFLYQAITTFTEIFLKSTIFAGRTMDEIAARASGQIRGSSETNYLPTEQLYNQAQCNSLGHFWSINMGRCYEKYTGGKTGVYNRLRIYLMFFIHFFQILAIIQLLSGQSFNNNK